MMDRREAMKLLAAGGLAVGAAGAGAAGRDEETTSTVEAGAAPGKAGSSKRDEPVTRGGLEFWLATTLRRVYPTSTAAESLGVGKTPLVMRSGRNYRLSFQACFRNLEVSSAQVECAVVGAEGVESQVRRVGFVPMHQLNTYTPSAEQEGVGKIPGLCPDPLWPEASAQIGPHGTGVFWISLRVPEATPAGIVHGHVRFTLLNRFGYMGWDHPEKFSVDLPFEIHVADVVVKRRANFPVTLWMSADSLWEYYRLEPFSERFWELADKYVANLTSHGVDVIYTPIFNIRAEKLKRPAQLLKVRRAGADGYEFDFSDVRRWIAMARRHGAGHVEFSHFFSPAPESAAYPQKIYERWEALGELLWPADTPATSETYRTFLRQFLPGLKQVLEEEGMLDKALFHLADEPDGEAAVKRYRAARALLTELAPWMRVMDAMSDPHFATERLSDMPVPSIATAHQFAQAQCPAWVYYCCGPRDGYIQRLLDTPLWKIRMTGWLFYRLGARGFLHWGYNYWFKFCTDQIADPFQDATNGAWPGMPYGDTFAVYPGSDGPLDSIRWEVFAESLQDYALLQTAGVDPADRLLAELKDYHLFPKDPGWVEQALGEVLARAQKQPQSPAGRVRPQKEAQG